MQVMLIAGAVGTALWIGLGLVLMVVNWVLSALFVAY